MQMLGLGNHGGWLNTVGKEGAACEPLRLLTAWDAPLQSNETSEPWQGYFCPGFTWGMYF